MLGFRFCARAFSSCGKLGLLFIAVRGPLTIAASRCGAQAPDAQSSVVVAHGLSCSAACGIFPDQGPNPCPLHWQADSQPLRHQGSPYVLDFNKPPKAHQETITFTNYIDYQKSFSFAESSKIWICVK